MSESQSLRSTDFKFPTKAEKKERKEKGNGNFVER